MNSALAAQFVKSYTGGPTIRVAALRTTEESAITVLFGASGSGKTTVLRCLAGLERPDGGTIQFGADVWFDSARGQFLAPRRRQVGFVPQDYALFPHLTVEQNLGYGLDALPSRERKQRVAELMAWLGVSGLEGRFPREMSGGQQQRVALGRAMARHPRLLLLDEPLSALDMPTRQRLRGELRALLRRFEVPTLIVTHDRQDALALGDDLVVMHEGQIVQQGPVQEVFSRPSSLAVAGIVAVETIQPGQVVHSSEGLVTVRVKEKQLTALAQELPVGATEVFVCIRAEDVILVQAEAGSSSPRNRLPGIVQTLTPEGPLVRVDIDCGFPLIALLTTQACRQMSLSRGDPVLALVKAPHIHLIGRQ